jgi:hypothetical protein
LNNPIMNILISHGLIILLFWNLSCPWLWRTVSCILIEFRTFDSSLAWHNRNMLYGGTIKRILRSINQGLGNQIINFH